jgi:Mg-chelatase subunit ChlD
MLTRAGCLKELSSLGGDGVLEPGRPEELPGWSRDDRVYQATGNHLSLPATREVGDLVRRFIGLKPGTGSIACVLVIDGSGSVKSTDKENMRGQAVELLISRLMPGDQVGVVSFNLSPRTILDLTDISSRKQARSLAAGIKKLPAKGDTNIAVGLARAAEMLARTDPKKGRVVVLMSDGKNDPETHNQATLQQVKTLAAEKAVLYTVGLTENVDQKFLFDLARLSKGIYLYAPSAEGLTAAFDRVQAAMDQASLLLLAQGKAPHEYKLLLDSTVQRLDLSLLGPGDLLDLEISDPKGKTLEPARATGREFSTMTLKRPGPGEYTLKVTGPQDAGFRLQATARTSLKARMEDKGKEPVANSPWFFSLDVAEDDLPLEKVRAEVLIKDSQGREHVLELKPAAQGGFSASASSAGALSARFRGFTRAGSAEFRARIFGKNRKKEPFQRLIVENLQVTEKAATEGFGSSTKGRVFKEEVRP